MSASAPNDPRLIDGALDRLEELLVREREALRRRDAATVAELATEKERLFEVLQTMKGPARDERATGRLRSLFGEVRRNAILLAYARDSLKGAMEALERAGIQGASTKSRLHVIG